MRLCDHFQSLEPFELGYVAYNREACVTTTIPEIEAFCGPHRGPFVIACVLEAETGSAVEVCFAVCSGR